jgi:thiamine pyrophosphate-dependent acetolactate synthase large subunit-like protein
VNPKKPGLTPGFSCPASVRYWPKADIVAYANSFGAQGHRLEDPSQFRALLDAAVAQGGVHVIDVPVDVQQNMALMKEMKSVDCSQFNRD